MINGWYELNSVTDADEDVPLDYFQHDHDVFFDIDEEDFGWEIWVRGKAPVGGVLNGIISKRENGGDDFGLELRTHGSNGLTMWLKSDEGGIGGSAVFSSVGIYDEEWHHLFLIFDRSSNVTLYIDGSSHATGSITLHEGYSFANTGDFLIGNEHTLAAAWPGDISAVRIYNFGLNGLPSNIADIVKYQHTNPGAIHADIEDDLLEGWDWHDIPSLIGRNQKLLTAIATPVYIDGGAVYRLQQLLTYQFRNANVTQKLIEVFAEQGIELSDAARDVQFLRSLSLAEGVQLDGIGQLCGESRNGRNDSDYRDAIYFRILVNSSKATASHVIAAAKIATDASKIVLLEKFPAKFSIITDGIKVLPNLDEILESVSAIAVGLDAVISTFGKSPMFYWQTEFGAQQGRGFAELNTTTGAIHTHGGKLAEQIA